MDKNNEGMYKEIKEALKDFIVRVARSESKTTPAHEVQALAGVVRAFCEIDSSSRGFVGISDN